MRRSLSGLTSENADVVARHLVASGQLLDVDPEQAWQHALAAQRRGGRVASVREASAIAAYKAGHFREALAELRTARRMTGDNSWLPLMADCERGLGRPERALDLANSPEVADLDVADRVEMLIVAAGARHDLGQHDAAVVSLQVPQLRTNSSAPWRARLFYAYADALISVGREDEAREWLEKTADADTDGETDATDRLAELDGLVFEEVDLEELGLEDDSDGDAQDDDARDDDVQDDDVQDDDVRDDVVSAQDEVAVVGVTEADDEDDDEAPRPDAATERED